MLEPRAAWDRVEPAGGAAVAAGNRQEAAASTLERTAAVLETTAGLGRGLVVCWEPLDWSSRVHAVRCVSLFLLFLLQLFYLVYKLIICIYRSYYRGHGPRPPNITTIVLLSIYKLIICIYILERYDKKFLSYLHIDCLLKNKIRQNIIRIKYFDFSKLVCLLVICIYIRKIR
jgi:hypothetical protein